MCIRDSIYVALAKKAVYGHVSIDSIAGPSEIMVLADESANAKFVAADLLSQAEHDELACAILVTTSMKLAEEVSKLTEEFIAGLSRKEILQKSIDNYGYILVADSMDDAVDVVNEIAPEHLEIQTINPFETNPLCFANNQNPCKFSLHVLSNVFKKKELTDTKIC